MPTKRPTLTDAEWSAFLRQWDAYCETRGREKDHAGALKEAVGTWCVLARGNRLWTLGVSPSIEPPQPRNRNRHTDTTMPKE